MGMFEELMAQAGGKVDLAALASRVNLDPKVVQSALSDLLPQLANPEQNNVQALGAVASKTGVSLDALSALVPQLLAAVQGAGAGKDGALGQLLAGMQAPAAGGAGGLPGNLASMLDRDGDGNPLNDIMGMFTRK